MANFSDQVLLSLLPQNLKAVVDAALAKGSTRQEILARCRRIAGGRRLVVLAVEAYLDSIKSAE
jgi:hypothetical protein